MIDGFETMRLKAERLTDKNALAFRAMEANPDVMKTLGGIQPDEVVNQKIRRNIDHWDQYGFGLWIFHDKAGNLVGRGSIRHLELDNVDHIEIGYTLMPNCWGQGLATEMAAKFIEIAAKLSIREIVAVTAPDNHASRRVMEKVGMRYVRDCVHYNMPCVLYSRAIL